MGDHDVDVRDNPAESRFEVRFDGDLAGFAVYRMRKEGRYAFVHTEVDPAFEGHGLGSTLVRSAMTTMADRGAAVLPFCPFVKGWLEKHPDLLGVVPLEERERFGLPR